MEREGGGHCAGATIESADAVPPAVIERPAPKPRRR